MIDAYSFHDLRDYECSHVKREEEKKCQKAVLLFQKQHPSKDKCIRYKKQECNPKNCCEILKRSLFSDLELIKINAKVKMEELYL